MTNSEEGWPPPPNTDEDDFERLTEGQEAILGTGAPSRRGQTPPEDDDE